MARTKGAAAGIVDHNAEYIRQLEDKIAMYESKKDLPEEVNTIQNTDYIKVMSLLNYHLNLCTKEAGQGKIFKFETFGQIKKILYSDLVDILEVHQNFLEAGYFYIMNPDVIRNHGLDEIYSKILDKKKIEKILEAKSDECVSLYSSANESQQELIVQLLVDKLIEDSSSVDMSVIDKISRLSKTDIYKKAQDAKELRSLPEETT